MKRIFERNLSSLILCYIQHIQGEFFFSLILLPTTGNNQLWNMTVGCLISRFNLSLSLSFSESFCSNVLKLFRLSNHLPMSPCTILLRTNIYMGMTTKKDAINDNEKTCHKFRIHGKYENSCSFISLCFPGKRETD